MKTYKEYLEDRVRTLESIGPLTQKEKRELEACNEVLDQMHLEELN